MYQKKERRRTHYDQTNATYEAIVLKRDLHWKGGGGKFLLFREDPSQKRGKNMKRWQFPLILRRALEVYKVLVDCQTMQALIKLAPLQFDL